MDKKYNIGIFDSGFGGLTILKEIEKALPNYNYIYLGDNARAPYGNRSFETVYKYTLEAVQKLFEMNCNLIILACNTASAKALRTIQQKDLKHLGTGKRVLGVIRPSTEAVELLSKTKHIGILGTVGTVKSESYVIEIQKMYPHLFVEQEACPMWVPLVENDEYINEGADYFIKKNIDNLLSKDPKIDTIILGCTHYPLLLEKIKQYTPSGITIVNQGEIVAKSLKEYLVRHPELESQCLKNTERHFFTTDSTEIFDIMGSKFLEKKINSQKITL
jgi:glutamate racemase